LKGENRRGKEKRGIKEIQKEYLFVSSDYLSSILQNFHIEIQKVSLDLMLVKMSFIPI
jgi:hypothetical protein